MSRRLFVVANPAAGRGRARRLLPPVLAALADGDAEPVVHRASSYPGAWSWASARVAEAGSSDALVVVGGDGMAHLGLNVCAGTDVPLGVVPLGTGNDFCRGAGLARDVTGAVAAIAACRTQPLDLARVEGPGLGGAEGRWVGCIVSTGFDARVGLRANRGRLRLGALAYGWATLLELPGFTPRAYRLVIDGAPRDLPAMAVFVGNTGMFGGGMRGCPDADPTDGLLDLTIIHPVSRFTLVRLLPRLYTGSFVRHPAVERLRAREVLVDGDGLQGAGDGEALGDVPLRVSSVPGALRVLAP